MTFIDKIRMQFINVLCSSCNERFSWIFTTILLKINISYRHDHYFITKQCTVANVLNYILVVDYTRMTAPPRCREGHSQVDVRVLGYRDHFLHPVQHLGPPRVEGHHTNHIHHTVHLVVLNPWNHQTWRACHENKWNQIWFFYWNFKMAKWTLLKKNCTTIFFYKILFYRAI